MIIVSACLAGIKCRYDGKDNLIPQIKQLVLEGKALPLCPEELGGLSTPRIPCEIKNKNNQQIVINKEGEDLTEAFRVGAEKVADIAKILNCKTAILKYRSPSCGYGMVYDGTFSGRIIPGKGLCAALLDKHGLQIFSEENYMEHINILNEQTTK